MDLRQIDGRLFRGRVEKLFCFEMVLPVLVVELELRTSLFLQSPLGWIKLREGLETVWTVVVGAFVNGHFLLGFPAKQSKTAIGTEKLRFSRIPEPVLDLEEMAADLAFDLRALLAVVEVEIVVGRIAAQADYVFGSLRGVPAGLYRRKGLAVKGFVLG